MTATEPTIDTERELALRRDVEQWLTDHNQNFNDYRANGGCKVFSRDEWHARKEKIGNHAALTIISESDLYHLWNDDCCFEKPPLDGLAKIADRHNYYIDLGFQWSAHFNDALDGIVIPF